MTASVTKQIKVDNLSFPRIDFGKRVGIPLPVLRGVLSKCTGAFSPDACPYSCEAF